MVGNVEVDMERLIIFVRDGVISVATSLIVQLSIKSTPVAVVGLIALMTFATSSSPTG